jgi:hypothetical protein
MTVLLDVNALIALAWPNHVHHQPARRWFATHHRAGWATTPITETGFVRVSSNPTAIPGAVRPAVALAHLELMRELDGHVFWPDDEPMTEADLARAVTHRQVTDARLVALAARHGGVVATFDRGLDELAAGRGLVELIAPAR